MGFLYERACQSILIAERWHNVCKYMKWHTRFGFICIFPVENMLLVCFVWFGINGAIDNSTSELYCCWAGYSPKFPMQWFRNCQLNQKIVTTRIQKKKGRRTKHKSMFQGWTTRKVLNFLDFSLDILVLHFLWNCACFNPVVRTEIVILTMTSASFYRC